MKSFSVSIMLIVIVISISVDNLSSFWPYSADAERHRVTTAWYKPDGMSVDPDWCTTKQHFTVGVRVCAFMLMRTAELLHSFIDSHCIRQDMVANQQLDAMATTTMWYRHCSLTATTCNITDNVNEQKTLVTVHRAVCNCNIQLTALSCYQHSFKSLYLYAET